MSEDNEAEIASVEIGYLKGDINGVTIKVRTDLGDGLHVLRFGMSTVTRGSPEIERQGHKHPWPDKVLYDPNDYADDIKAARQAAREELESRNLTDRSEWRDE